MADQSSGRFNGVTHISHQTETL